MARANIEIVLSNGEKAGRNINKLRQQANRLTKEVNKWDEGTDEFVRASADLQKVQARLKDVRNEAKGVSKANQGVLSSFSQYIPFGGVLGKMAQGVRLGVAAFKSLRVAIAATGIGLIVLAVASLFAWFKRTEAGSQKLRVIMAGLGQVFDSVMDVVTSLGERIFKAFSNPKKAITDLWQLIKTNIMNRISGLIDTFKFFGRVIKSAFELDWDGVKENAAKAGESVLQTLTGVDEVGKKIVEGFNKVKEGVVALATELKDDALAAMKLAEDENKLRIRNREFLIEEAKLRAEIAEAREFATDVTRTDEERQKALARAIQLQNEVEAKKIALKQEQLRILKAQQEISITDEAGYEEAARLEAELISLQEARASSMRRLTAQESALRLRINNDRQKEIDKAADAEKKARENIEDITIELMEEGLEREIALLQLGTERKIEALIGSEEQIREQKKLLEELELQELQELRDKYAKARAERAAKEREKQAKKNKEAADKAIKEEKRRSDAVRQIQQDGVSAFNDATDAIIGILSKDEKAKKKNAKAIKVFETGRVAVGLQAELQAIWEYANKNPANALFPGAAQAIALVKSALAVGRAGIAIGKISAQKFERGGILKGARHVAGGIPGIVTTTGQPIEMEDGEIVLTRGVGLHPEGRRIASNLNAAFGGRKFEAGGPVSPLVSRVSDTAVDPDASASAAQQQATGERQGDLMIAEFRSFREEISNWQRNLKTNINMQEVRDKLETLISLQDESEV